MWIVVFHFAVDALWLGLGWWNYREGKTKSAIFWGGLGLIFLAWDLIRFL